MRIPRFALPKSQAFVLHCSCIVAYCMAVSLSSAAASSQDSSVASRFRRLDEGQLLGAVGKGGFGRVYAAVDSVTNNTVVVKRQMLPSDDAARELAWYKALRQVPHANIMRLLHDFSLAGSGGVAVYMVFDFMDTCVWAFWKQRRRLVCTRTCLSFLSDLLHGLVHLQDLDIIHGDLSMGNMLLQASRVLASSQDACGYTLRIADLGRAMCASAFVLPADEDITTEYARAPEMLLGSREPTMCLDLWAVGICALALFSGSLVWHRIPGLEPSLPGLFSCVNAGFQGLDSTLHDIPGLRTFRNMVAVLGAPSEDNFPGCSSLPLWHRLGPVISSTPAFASLSFVLTSAQHVRRPVSGAEPAHDFIKSLLRWDPVSRLPAKHCLQHALFMASSLNVVEHALVGQLSIECLRRLVVESVSTDLPITRNILVAEAEAQFHSRADAYMSGDEAVGGGGGAAACSQDAGMRSLGADVQECPDEVGNSVFSVKRRRLRSKQRVEYEVAPQVSTAASHDEDASAPILRLCACLGNCGVRACKNRKNCGVRACRTQICENFVQGDATFCSFCICELCGEKGKQQIHGMSRWCTSCCMGSGSASSQVSYANKHGSFKVDKDWPLSLQLSARFAWVDRLGSGIEGGFYRWFVDGFLAWRGFNSVCDIQHPGDVMMLMFVGCIRWPLVVFQIWNLREGFEPRIATASDWHAFLVRLLNFAAGHVWKEMHDCISPGRSGINFGLVWLCKALGIIRKATNSDQVSSTVGLGVLQTRYVLLDQACSQESLQGIIDGVAKVAFRFPGTMATFSQLRAFCQHVSELVDHIVGSQSTLARGYCCGKFLRLLERVHGEEMWDDLDMGVLADIVADENEHLHCLRQWKAGEVRRRFGVSPLAVSGLSCFWKTVPTERIRRLKAKTNSQILNAAILSPGSAFDACQEQARLRGQWLHFIVPPNVWAARLDAC